MWEGEEGRGGRGRVEGRDDIWPSEPSTRPSKDIRMVHSKVNGFESG
jgi:hypothetical protein